jgi:DNA-binding MarR family transcriptional regulator
MTPSGFNDLDRTIHEGARLAVMSILAASDEVSFRELRDALGLTDGNLGAHLKTLEAAGFVKVRRVQGEGRPTSFAALTPQGRAAFAGYLRMLESIIGPARKAAPKETPGRLSIAPG